MAADPASGGGHPAKPATKPAEKDGLPALVVKSRKKWPRRLLVATNILVLALLLLGVSAYGYVEWRFGQVARTKVRGLTAAGSGPLTILVVGSDTRNLGKGASAAFGTTQDVSGQRSDTIMLVRIIPATSSIALLSVPRDLLVPVPGQGTTRINAAFSGGPDLLVQTVHQDLGIAINHFAVVDFSTFTQIADAIGGVYQFFPTPARDLYSGLTVAHAGCILLKGSQALAFVRSREYQYLLDGSWHYQLVPESDLARIQRQQDFMKLALKKAAQVAPTDPLALNQVISGVTGSLTVDSSFSSSLMLDLALDMRRSNVAGIPSWTYPTVNSTEVPGALDPVSSEDQQVVHEFLTYGVPAPKPATAAAVRPASMSAEVRNGPSTPGQVAEAAGALEALRFNVKFDVRSTGDTRHRGSSATGTTIWVTVASATEPAATTTTGPPSSTASAAVSVDSSSYYQGRYVPPGLEPGQVPEDCPS